MPVHYNATSASIVQPLPASPALGDECELYLDSSNGTNTLTATFGGATVATLKVASHMATARFNGTTWLDAGPGKKTLASEDGRYLTMLTPLSFGAKGSFGDSGTSNSSYQVFVNACLGWRDMGTVPRGPLTMNGASIGTGAALSAANDTIQSTATG